MRTAPSRRRSRFEGGHTPLHAAFAPPDGLGHLAGEPDYAMLALLIELGGDLEATDDKGRTPLALALLRGDQEAIRLLRAAGAQEPPRVPRAETNAKALAAAGASVKKSTPSFAVRDMRTTVRWYQSIGFTLADAYEEGGELGFARLTFGSAEFALSPGGNPGPRDVSQWFFTDRVQELYEFLRTQQLHAAVGVADSSVEEFDIRFAEDLHTPFYGGRQFSIKDTNGLTLVFWQPEWLAPSASSAPMR